MAKLRKFCAYRRLERPYTRKSKFRKLSFVRASPRVGVVRFDMGNAKGNFEKTMDLISKTDLQIRHNAIESARQSCNRILEKKIGKENYHFRIMIYPHHILRENPLAAGAGADRMSTGMKRSFGKSIGVAARVKKGQTVLKIKYNKKDEKLVRLALERAYKKLPSGYSIINY